MNVDQVESKQQPEMIDLQMPNHNVEAFWLLNI